jgi:hypothetical protein
MPAATSLDCPTLKPLPCERYQYAQWTRCTAAPDYHVEVDRLYRSVTFHLPRESVDVLVTDARRYSTRARRCREVVSALGQPAAGLRGAWRHAGIPRARPRPDHAVQLRGVHRLANVANLARRSERPQRSTGVAPGKTYTCGARLRPADQPDVSAHDHVDLLRSCTPSPLWPRPACVAVINATHAGCFLSAHDQLF